MNLIAQVLIDGAAEGKLLKLEAPICIWGGIDPATGRISDPKNPNHNAVVTGDILAIPKIIGSSSSSQLLLELLYKENHPSAIILGEADAILGLASLVGREMAFGSVPILQMPIDILQTGMAMTIEQGGRVHVTAKP